MKQMLMLSLVVVLIHSGSSDTESVSAENVEVTSLSPWGVSVAYDVPQNITNDSQYVAQLSFQGYIPTLNDDQCVIGDVSSKAGRKRLSWNLAKLGYSLTNNISVSLVKRKQRYCVVDLSSGPDSVRYGVAYYDEEPSGGWGASCWSDKIVLRRIEPGEYMFSGSGSVDDKGLVLVRLTKPFYFAIHCITYRQYDLVMGSDHQLTDPYICCKYEDIRGDEKGVSWPTNSAVDATSFMGRLRLKTGMGFDLPTEAQWEYAYRAGSETGLMPEPNAWGIYQANHGNGDYGYYDGMPNNNTSEWCLDNYGYYSWEWIDEAVDPKGPLQPDMATGRVQRKLGVKDPLDTRYRSLNSWSRGFGYESYLGFYYTAAIRVALVLPN